MNATLKLKIRDHGSVMVASAVKIEEGLRPSRIVLRSVGGYEPWATHLETLKFDPKTGRLVHEEFHWGTTSRSGSRRRSTSMHESRS